MPYSPTTWIEGVTTVGPTNLNHLETGVAAAVPKDIGTTAGDIVYWTGASTPARLALGAAGTVLKGGASAPSWATIVNADVDAAAAIVQSKLAFDAWQSYTPAWTSSGTQPVLGNGTAAGRYVQIGKTVHVQARIVLGSTSTVGTGTYFFSIPVPASANETGVFGTAQLFDSSAGAIYIHAALVNSNSTAVLYSMAQPAVAASATAPVVPATSDEYRLKLTYEAA